MVRLTGRRRYRASDDGSIVLQVEEEECFRTNYGSVRCPDTLPYWRDARVEDLTAHDAMEAETVGLLAGGSRKV